MQMRSRYMVPAMLVAATLVACGGEAPPREAVVEAPAGTPVAVRDTALTDYFNASGVAEPVRRAMLATKLMARVTEVLVHEGDRVAAGQVLVRLDARDLDAKREQVAAGLSAAEAAHREAVAHTTRIRALYADSAAPRAQLDQAEAMLARAEAGVRQAQAGGAELEAIGDYATLRAPFPGTVVQRMADPGGFAAPGQPLVVVEDQSSLRIAVTAAPDAVRGVRAGQTLSGAVAGRPVEARVEGVAPAAGGHVVTVNAIVTNRDGTAFAGSAATLALPQGTRRGIVIPGAAVVREGDLTGARVRRGTVAGLRWLKLGPAHDGLVEVLAGLSIGDTVLVPAGER